MKRSLLAILLAITVVVSADTVTRALRAPLDIQSTSTVVARNQTTPAQTDDTTSEEKRLELEARKLELEKKLAEKRAAITTKLMGERADRCEKKQGTINSILDKRVLAAQKHFDTFKNIQEKLSVVVDDNAIVVENEVALQRVMNLLQAKTEGSIEALEGADFDCANADASAPGAIVKDQISIVKQDLKDYRDSIKDYAQSIKASVEAASESQVEEESSTEEEPATEAPVEETPTTDQTTEGAQL